MQRLPEVVRGIEFIEWCKIEDIPGYDRIESVRPLNQDAVMKAKLGIDNCPDPETFRDELLRYSIDNIEQLFFVNQRLLDVICNLTEARYVDLHFDARVITVYGDQEGAEVGYNPHKFGRKSYHLKVCTVEPFGFILTISLEPGTAVSSAGFVEFYQKSVAALPQNHLVIQNVRLDSGFFSEDNIEAFEGDFISKVKPCTWLNFISYHNRKIVKPFRHYNRRGMSKNCKFQDKGELLMT